MKIDDTPIDSITPYATNPRFNDAAVEVVAESIRQFGFQQPIVVDSKGVIIVGHTRLKAAQLLGLDTVPVHVAKGLTAQQVKAYRLADNKTNEAAVWDFDLLPLELEAIDEIDMDVFGDWDLPEPEPAEDLTDLSDKIHDAFFVDIECQDEQEQRAIHEKMTAEGYSCKPRTL